MIGMQKNLMGATLVVAGALSLGAIRPAGAVVLEQKFQTGQSANYDVSLSGTLNLNASEQTPVPWAGMPLAVPVTGYGQVAFDTLATNSNGGATVRTRVPVANLSASAFGMSAVITEKDGVGSFSLNGSAGKTIPLPFLTNPKYAVNLSRLGRIEGVTAIPSAVTSASAKPAISSTGNAVRVVKVAAGDATTMQKWLDMMPNVWPTRDLKAGDTWSVVSNVPVASAPNGVLNLGSTNFKLIGEEKMGGVVLQRISVNGAIVIDAAKAAILNAAKPAGSLSKDTARLVSDSKTVNGDIWFDANAGRIARAELKVAASNVMSGTSKSGDSRAWNSTQGFDGTFAMQLSGVSVTPVKAAAKAMTSPKTS